VQSSSLVMKTRLAQRAIASLALIAYGLLACDPLSVQTSAPIGGASLATFEQMGTAGAELTSQAGQAGRPSNQAGVPLSQGGSPAQSALGDMGLSIDMSQAPPASTEPDSLFEACVGEMDDLLVRAWEPHCASYPMEGRVNQGPYSEELVIGACLKLSCEGVDLEGHNGLMVGRSCYDLDLLRQALSAAARDAIDEGGCVQPLYSVKVIPLDQRVFGDPCDEIICQIEPDGVFTRGE